MKTVSGKVISTKPVSLSQAARTISTFISADNGGASQAVAAYLKRTSAAFNELVQFHKDYKVPNFKTKKSRPVDPVNSGQVRVENLENGRESKKNKRSPVTIEQKGIEVQGKIGKEERVEGDSGRKKDKRKKKKGSEGNFGIEKNVEEGEGEREVSVGDGEGKKEKKIGASLGNVEEVEDFERKKEKRKKKTQGVERESERNLGIEEEGKKGKKEKKRKKSEEVDENSLEQIGHKKKKRRRVEGDD